MQTRHLPSNIREMDIYVKSDHLVWKRVSVTKHTDLYMSPHQNSNAHKSRDDMLDPFVCFYTTANDDFFISKEDNIRPQTAGFL
ncbi:hypothetical protein TNCT_272691 [Trichonephila clavata]|uniref:Uncharacterized protein n=1 Tax=Trichonephila clavata TaxID=2740835 RepID=A0A8X6LQ41_TRICU|nr:hypothetical protein TNCT_272691 [Trichonephila clavata]